MTRRKIAGCVLGFAGVVVINLLGNSLDMGFKLIGEGFVLIAQLSYGISTVLINLFFQKSISGCIERNAVYDGWNRSDADWSRNGWSSGKCYYRGCGNYILSGNGFGSGIYALVVLLAWNDVSKVAIFGFVNPLCGVILSALILGEVKQAFNVGSLALILVCAGIYIVNCKENKRE